MRPKERRESGQSDFFKARLDQIVDLDLALAKLGRASRSSATSCARSGRRRTGERPR
jgi:hypothetical protein